MTLDMTLELDELGEALKAIWLILERIPGNHTFREFKECVAGHIWESELAIQRKRKRLHAADRKRRERANADHRPLGGRIRSLYEQRGLTRAEFARRINAAYNTVWRYERGETKPRMDILMRIAKTLDVDANYLLTGQIKGAESRS